jgi:TRAP-type C4-dicarboxylate transport system permease large subunit
VPSRVASWIQGGVVARWEFLIALNVFLLAIGCLMDIFSAIFVVVPLLLPLATMFDVDPLHLGAIVLINLELGCLTPPVGMNLFLASFRFNRPVLEVARAAAPFVLVQLIGVLLVTYVPGLSISVAAWRAR